MTKFIVDISDKAQLVGIASARAEYNKTLPPDQQLDDAGYVQYVMTSAAISYANQYNLTTDKIAGLQAQIDAANAKLNS